MRWPTWLAMVWMVWMPVAPVPITATRLPAKSTGSFGHRAVWNDAPLKSSRPSMRGRVGVESGPIAVIRKRELKRLPSSSVMVQLRVSSS